MNRKVARIIDQLLPYNPEKIILFGSYAYGKPTKESDVDVVLIKRTLESFSERLKKVRMLLRTTTPVDVFVFTPEEFEGASKTNPLIEEISKMGKIIYGQSSQS
jgi:predicted nucleotidyltransferase